nr:hypothetical protein [Tanacetum cinerariifolium]
MIDQGVTAALAARDALRNTNGDDSHNSETGVRRTERANRECTYTDFLKCQPLPFKGTEGVASLFQWCERMESVFHISNCAAENQVKFATCTLHSIALTWWNTHVQTVGYEAAYGMPWKTLIKMMTEKYCPRNEIRKLEMELWDLKNLIRFEKYVGGILDMIHGSVVASKPKTMQEAIEIATELMDKKIRTFAERERASKRKSKANTNNANNQRGTGLGQRPACYECGVQGHFKRECPKLKNNNNHGNQGGRNNAPARVYAIGRAGTDPDANVVTGTTMSCEELELTKIYIPKILRGKHIPVHLKPIIHDLENISIHEGRTMHLWFAQHSNLKMKFYDVHLQCLNDVDEDIYPGFLLKLFSSATILRDEERGDCVYSNEYSLESLNKNVEEVYPYKTNIPTPDENISDITINGVTEDPLKIRKNGLRRDFKFWNEVIERNDIREETYSQQHIHLAHLHFPSGMTRAREFSLLHPNWRRKDECREDLCDPRATMCEEEGCI